MYAVILEASRGRVGLVYAVILETSRGRVGLVYAVILEAYHVSQSDIGGTAQLLH